jgi:hypothetical protein
MALIIFGEKYKIRSEQHIQNIMSRGQNELSHADIKNEAARQLLGSVFR